jgi:N-carbamoylputrescine amidase
MESGMKTTLAIVQMRMSDVLEENVAKAMSFIREAAGKGANVVLLPELFEGYYWPQVQRERFFARAHPLDDHPFIPRFQALARELGVVLPLSFFERAGQAHYNSLVMIDASGDLVGLYRKSHIPDGPGYMEKYYFTPGDTGFRAWRTRYATIGVLVCWDQWFPEGARLTALSGAQILFYPTAIGWHPSEKAQYGAAQHDAWRTIQRSHAIANGLYVAAVNRVGYEGPPEHGLEFWGGSFVSDPFGQVLAEASHDREETLIVECDPRRIEEVRRNWPFLRDRRIDAYQGILSRVLD